MEVTDVVPAFADAFPFEEFNRMQRRALPAILESDANAVVAAPTASGKTALAELAMCRVLEADGTAVFIAPLRALTNEREAEWERFEALGYSVYVVTGERDLDPRRAARADVLVMTPEKADSATRNHDSPRYDFITDIDLCVIDEVHLLDSATRGAVLEATISRLRRLCDPRIVALSATLPNVEDVADWLDAPSDNTFEFGDDYRPVDLHASVETYTHGENAWADKYRRLYTALDLAEPHLDAGQALVFVSSRQDTVRAAEKARDELAARDIDVGIRGDYDRHQAADTLENKTLRQSVIDGVGFHHAGLAREDKTLVEDWFRNGDLDLLFSTSTLAWGVNLPARCVVIRDTKLHDPLEGEVEMSPIDVLQMLGRAGRPGYDDVGHAYVVAAPEDADRYRRLLEDGSPVESRLADRLAEHLNAEIAMGTVQDVEDVADWLDTTYYAVRARRHPDTVDSFRDRATDALDSLVDRGFVATDDRGLEPTALGRLTSHFYLELDTATRFRELPEAPTETDVLTAVATAAEFDSVTLRSDETDAVADVVDATDLDAGARKVLAVLTATMDGGVPQALRSDAWAIRSNADRLFGALAAFCEEFRTPHAANLVRRIAARVETGVPADAVGLTAIDGIGAGRAHQLAAADITTPADVRAAGVEGLVDAGLGEGVAAHVHDQATALPAVTIDWAGFPDAIAAGDNTLQEATVHNDGAGARAGIAVTVNDIEMTRTDCYLGDDTTVPVGVYGADDDTLTYRVTVAFPDLPLVPATSTRTVEVT
ncbi:MAG: DEAD/DEAH box helicase [Halobacteriaceae archaeon]